MRTITDDDRYAVLEARPHSFSDEFFVGVKSTGIFCRIGCPARLPKRDNCMFYDTAEQALSAGFRACKRCHPSSHAGEASSTVKKLITLIENAPDKRWTETDIKAAGIDPSTARRQFKKRFGLTFAQYARARRLGAAAQNLAKGESVINAQLNAGYESASGFRKAFADSFGSAPANASQTPLFIEWMSTPLGPLFTVCDETHLYMLEFTTRKNIERGFEKLRKVHKRAVIPGRTAITDQIEAELEAYFEGNLTRFKTPLFPTGTEFQNRVWKALQDIPYGESCAYSDLAISVGNEKAVRAVASSNANNGLALIIPCHRVIAKDGGLGGYAGGLEKKEWLLNHEKSNKP
ncbi:bifunctional transcriptional activator/DNA repair enzyme AdaA [Hellea balneolensis]|uniref:bifunctional transcriptional activator/DNA repair enzyme AdaA n=1 Tax=Hellea balneolensis TaxID=287478 RepID=UPI000687F8AE|nr:trifunctional transcriptional activator/DNA repair protein Ada/methylated-DNA--[protein]-cysteine S-methyltransferase [Hellea balneolensis]